MKNNSSKIAQSHRRHCERSEAIQLEAKLSIRDLRSEVFAFELDCFASLAMTTVK